MLRGAYAIAAKRACARARGGGYSCQVAVLVLVYPLAILTTFNAVVKRDGMKDIISGARVYILNSKFL
jgi:hypothetical protein